MPRQCLGRMILASLLPVVAGCATTPSECDPLVASVGFVTKAKCFYSGEYDRREKAKRDVLEEELRIKSLFEETYAALKAEQARIALQSTEGRIHLEQVSESVESLQSALQVKLANDKQLNHQISQLKVEVKKIQEQPGQSPVQQRQALSDLMVKVADLQQTLELR